jgi:hypothetical protein
MVSNPYSSVVNGGKTPGAVAGKVALWDLRRYITAKLNILKNLYP